MFQFRRFPRYAYLIQHIVPGYEPRWVSSFRDPRINAYLQLPEAYRSLSRLSSAPSAKAFALRPCSLDRQTISFEIICSSWFSHLPTKIICYPSLEIVIFLSKELTIILFRSYYSVFKVRLWRFFWAFALQGPQNWTISTSLELPLYQTSMSFALCVCLTP